MKTRTLCWLTALLAWLPQARGAEKPPVRVAVVGGVMNGDAWPELARQFTAATGVEITVVVSGQRELCAEALSGGKVDAAIMHSGDIATNLVADGFAVNVRPFARNEMVIFGPKADPAGVRGLADGAAALKKIAAAQAPFVDFRGAGSRELTRMLWKKAGVEPVGSWVLKDESANGAAVLEFARQKAAYVLVNRPPPDSARLPGGALELLVQGDPAMRRAFVVAEANPAKFPTANAAGARRFSDYLVSEQAQTVLRKLGGKAADERPLLFPLRAE
jgi:tungstate transport system substrate-binding protein